MIDCQFNNNLTLDSFNNDNCQFSNFNMSFDLKSIVNVTVFIVQQLPAQFSTCQFKNNCIESSWLHYQFNNV